MIRALMNPLANDWSVGQAREMYHIDRWGAGYYDINTAGRVVAKPLPGDDTAVELSAVIAAAQKRDLDGPLLIRFQDILRHRVKSLCTAFDEAIARNGYEGRYRGVFPIKVNELREVVEEVMDAGADNEFGLEVGSKAELFAALALQDLPNALLICNGYKDADFIRTALTGTRLGKQVILVIEKLDELDQILRVAKREGVQPQLGIRLRLLSRSTGKWADSGGEDAKFGLNTAQLMAALERLRAEGWEDSCVCCIPTSGRRYRIFSPCARRFRRPRGFMPRCARKGFRWSIWMSVAVWRWITTGAVRRLKARPIILCGSTRMIWCKPSRRCATRKRCRIRIS